MPTDQILALLTAERDKLNRAVEALQGQAKRRGRPPKSATATKAAPAPKKRGRTFTAAQRKAQAERMRKMWVAKKKAAVKATKKH